MYKTKINSSYSPEKHAKQVHPNIPDFEYN